MFPTRQPHPMPIGDLLDAAFHLYRANFGTFIGLVLPLQVPLAVIQFLVPWGSANHALPEWIVPNDVLVVWPFFGVSPLVQMFPPYMVAIGIAVIQYVFIQNLLAGVLTCATARLYSRQSTCIASIYRLTIRRAVALMPASLVLWVIRIILGGLMLASISTTVTIVDYLRRWPHPGSIVLLILMLGLWLTSVLVGVQVYANYVLAPQAIILEDCGPWSGLGRSRQLMKVSSRRAFLIVIPISALVYLLTAIPAALVGFVVRSRSGTFSDMDLAHIQMMVTLAAHFGLIIALPLQYAFLTLVYYDLRISTEGYDLEALAQNEALP